MREFQNVIIGFGKGGKTLAGALAANGESVALIEKSDKMYGGTCINAACIPSKFLEDASRFSDKTGGDFESRSAFYKKTIESKRELIAKLRDKNYHKIADAENAEVITGAASFVDSHHVKVTFADGREEELSAGRIFINTGARPFVPSTKGVKESRFVYLSETLMELDKLPKDLTIIGGGYIGLEFASYYANFGSKVTVIQHGDAFLPREDAEVAEEAFKSLTDRGIRILKNTDVQEITDEENHAIVHVKTLDGEEKIKADAVLVATGRRSNTEGLNLEAAGVELTERGAIKTDEHLKTTADHIWAMGDVVGGLQFTYISLDDSRIVKSQLLGDGGRTTENRGAVPYTMFIDPPFSRVGLTEMEARKEGYEVKIAKLAVSAIPKALLMKRTAGMMKVIIDAKTDRIIGAHLFSAESQEMINILKLAVDAGIPYTGLRDNIYTHPTMSESLNDLLAQAR